MLDKLLSLKEALRVLAHMHGSGSLEVKGLKAFYRMHNIQSANGILFFIKSKPHTRQRKNVLRLIPVDIPLGRRKIVITDNLPVTFPSCMRWVERNQLLNQLREYISTLLNNEENARNE